MEYGNPAWNEPYLINDVAAPFSRKSMKELSDQIMAGQSQKG
jgi:hypothetical protein